MARATATLVDAAMDTWMPDTRHYVTSDGKNLAVHVDVGMNEETRGLINETLAQIGVAPLEVGEDTKDGDPTLTSGLNTIVLNRTTIVECDEFGTISGDSVPEPLYSFDPGTSHEDALALAGFTVQTKESES